MIRESGRDVLAASVDAAFKLARRAATAIRKQMRESE